MLGLLSSNPLAFLLLIFGLVISITIHEFAHAWMADHLGDPTPRSQDRLTLNPLAHLDPLGSLLLLVTGFGWGRPVVFDPYNLQNLRRDVLLIAAAGPASNLLLATALAFLLPFLPLPFVWQFVISINITLAAFNLIPIHPLDGGKILSSLLPPELSYEYDSIFERYGFIVLLLLVFPIFGSQSAVSYIMRPMIGFITSAIFGLASLVR